MIVYYLDTSAVLKRYRTKKGTDVVNELYRGLTEDEALLASYLTCLDVSLLLQVLHGPKPRTRQYSESE